MFCHFILFKITAVILNASSNCCIQTLTNADPRRSIINGFLNYKKKLTISLINTTFELNYVEKVSLE